MTCLGLHAHMFASMLHTPFVLRPTCLDVHSHARMLVSLLMFVLYMTCLCAQTQAMFVMLCAIVVLLSLYLSFLCFLPNGSDSIQNLRSLSSSIHRGHIKRFGSPYLHVNAYLLLCFMLVLAFLILGFAMFGALRGLDLVWLHSTPMRPHSDVTAWDVSSDAGLLRVYPFLACHAYYAYLLYAFSHPFLPLLVCWFFVFAFECSPME